MNAPKTISLRRDDTTLLVVDFQERLLPQIHGGEQAAEAAMRMIRAAGVLTVPIVTSEQYPRGLGPTVPGVRDAYPAGAFQPIEKTTFSCCGTEAIVDAIRATRRNAVVVVGIEAHVCVQQTVLDLLSLGHATFVCADAIGSRREFDCRIAIDRMRQAGAVVTTTESGIFELLGRAGTDQFKQILPIVK